MISNQLTAQVMPSEKAPVAFKLKTARSLKYKMYTKSSSSSNCWTSPQYVRDTYDRSIRPMLGDWERYFSCQPFCLTRCQTWYLEVCLSAVCVTGAGIIIENIWQGILRLFPRIEPFVFLGYLNQLEKIRKCLFDRISSPLERTTLYVPPSPSEICLF